MPEVSFNSCLSDEIALKGLFLGPQAENQEWVSEQISTLLQSWFEWRRKFRPDDGCAISATDMLTTDYIERRKKTEEVLQNLTLRFEAEIPKFSPRYIGHMFSETSLPSLFGHILTLLHNPNNISGESSKVGVFIEDEAIQALAQMIGFPESCGHFTSGGTLANYEAVYRARSRCFSWMAAGLAVGETSAFRSAVRGWKNYDTLSKNVLQASFEYHPLEGNPFQAATRISQKTGKAFLGPIIIVPDHKHYSWVKAANVFGLGTEAFWSVKLDACGRMDVDDLEKQILRAEREDRPVLMVVSVLGTTELGMIDPVDKIQNLLDSYQKTHSWHFWHHIDAAYGGFLCSLQGDNPAIRKSLSEESLCALQAVSRATSLTIDPHKLGYVPYSSGAFLASTRRDYFQQSFGAPYVNFNARQDKGPFTLEGSRSAAGAVATWMAAQCIGLTQEGYGKIIARTILLKKEFEQNLRSRIANLQIVPAEDSNLLGFCIARPGESLEKTNLRTMRIFEAFNSRGSETEFFVSKTTLSRKNYSGYIQNFVQTWNGESDTDELTLIRLCIMNPFFKSKEMKVNLQELFIKTLSEIALEGKS